MGVMAIHRSDILIIGSGVAGLRAALQIAGAGRRVTLLTKDAATDSSSDKAQGGIAAALSDDDEIGLHFRDTLEAGDGLCHEGAVRVLVEEGPARALELIDWGADFDREGARLALGREGAHSRRRILHARGDSTGREIVRTLLQAARAMPGIELLAQMFSIDLLVAGGRCVGLIGLDEHSGETSLLFASAVVLSTGGVGQVYRETTNPAQATGDGIAMAYRAGAELMDMEFVQFHPTALYVPGAPRFLLSEAMRGEGGRLLDGNGGRFMADRHPHGDLAPRDIVARGIVDAMRSTGSSCVYLDMRGCDPGFVRRRFPTIAATCAHHGIDIARDRIPVSPCAHYMMGGVKTDLHGRTSIPGLYAAGEVACTGVHGANRLASNSLLEGLVFGARAGLAVIQDRLPEPPTGGDLTGVERIGSIAPREVPATVDEVRRVMWEEVGIVRRAQGLQKAVGAILALERRLRPGAPTRGGLEARNLLFAGRLIAESALQRKESRGSHYRDDFPRAAGGRGRHSIIAPGAIAADLPCVPLPDPP
jgi:L-aspartate oxidase